MSADIPLLLFAKAPIAGKVKTRLTAHCSDQQAAEIAEILMQASVEKAVSAWPGKVYLSVWLDSEHDFFNHMLQRYPIVMTQQCAGDLGEKMRHALHSFGYPAAVMGCDAPHVTRQALNTAHQALSRGQSVIGPAQDGGYYFLGLSQQADNLFSDKSWGTNAVLTQTMQAAKQSGLSLTQLAPLDDVDEWRDVLTTKDLIPELENYLSANNL